MRRRFTILVFGACGFYTFALFATTAFAVFVIIAALLKFAFLIANTTTVNIGFGFILNAIVAIELFTLIDTGTPTDIACKNDRIRAIINSNASADSFAFIASIHAHGSQST
jgi:hypothetical protein